VANWSQALRERVVNALPGDHLLPDKQPSYVRSVVYLFGSLTIGNLLLIIISGIVLAFNGPHWWHVDKVGHFFNSLHFWSVQGFFFFMVLHLWGMFFMGAYRDRRGRTWVMGAIAFIVSIMAAFTGYLSQTNFDSQWIGVSAKDAMNSIGIGGLFNVLNFGQMYSFHIFLLPLALAVLIGIHLLLVRLMGVVRPYRVKGEKREAVTRTTTQEEYYHDVTMKNFDILKELTIMSAIALVIVVVMAAVFSSPDEKALTLKSVAGDDPLGFTTVALSELAGSSTIASYGPPYNNGDGSVQSIGPLSPQKIAGVSLPVNTANVYVLGPLSLVDNADLKSSLQTFNSASADAQTNWENAYADALNKADGSLDNNGHLKIASDPSFGPLPVIFNNLLDLGRSGALDGYLLTVDGKFYQSDFTKPLLFLNEKALPDRADSLNLAGDQWGMMNSAGAYPGQAWLWLYTFWYQVPGGPYNGPNADVAVWLTMAVLTLLLIIFPYIPFVNRLPEYLGVHRLIWRSHYKETEATVSQH
jgi:Cytochrome b(N-terminal)/b6/petB